MSGNCQGRVRLKSCWTGKIGLNINGDLSRHEIIERAKIAESSGIRVVWVGEFEGFEDPFEVASVIAESTGLKIGFGVVTTTRRTCREILERFEGIRKRYGDRFILGLGAGEGEPGRAYRSLRDCIEALDRRFPVVVGAGSPMTLRLAGKTGGVLFNSVNPEFLEWMMEYIEKDVFKAAYGPALILPSEFEEDLLLAASIVFLGSRNLIRRFGFEDIAEELSKVDIMGLVNLRRSGRSIFERRDAGILHTYKDFLLEKFTLSGTLEEVKAKISRLLKLCDHVILSDPFFRDLRSMGHLRELAQQMVGR